MINFTRYKKVIFIYLTNISLTGLTSYYLQQNYYAISNQVPFFYTMEWGDLILAPKNYLISLLILSFIISNIYLYLSIRSVKIYNFRLVTMYSYTMTILNIALCYYIFRIINLVNVKALTIPASIKLIVIPGALAFVITYAITPLIIKLAYKFKFIDDPLTHKHPAMLISKPVPRAGGLAFYIGLLIPALVLLPIFTSQKLFGIMLGSLICMVTGLIDDRRDVHPLARLVIQGVTILITVLSGIILIYIPNPFGEAIKLDSYKWVFDFFAEDHTVYYYSVLAAAVWIGWVMNFMSWANGTDGVYAGLVSISSLTIAILMMLTLNVDKELSSFITLAALVAGAGFAMAFYTWPPMKMLWGFGATAPALIIAALSILGSTKVATTLIVLMIPFLDSIFAIFRRIRRKQNPLYGDREHFHHKLLNLGWSKQKIAFYYWLTTACLAIIGVITSGKSRALSFLTVAALAIIVISLTNLLSIKKPKNGVVPH